MSLFTNALGVFTPTMDSVYRITALLIHINHRLTLITLSQSMKHILSLATISSYQYYWGEPE